MRPTHDVSRRCNQGSTSPIHTAFVQAVKAGHGMEPGKDDSLRELAPPGPAQARPGLADKDLTDGNLHAIDSCR